MDTQGHTSSNVSEEEEIEGEHRDTDLTARDIISSQTWASQERLNAWRVLQRCRCQGCGGCSRLATNEQLTPRLGGLPHVHATMVCRATPTSSSLIGLVSSYRRRFQIANRDQNIRFSAAKCKGRTESTRALSLRHGPGQMWRAAASLVHPERTLACGRALPEVCSSPGRPTQLGRGIPSSLWTDLRDADVDHRCIYGTRRAGPHPLPATC